MRGLAVLTFMALLASGCGVLDSVLGNQEEETKKKSSPTVSILDPEPIAEGDVGTRTLTFTVVLSKQRNASVTVQYTTEAITATSDQDYEEASGTLTIAAGELLGVIEIDINADNTVEEDETFKVVLVSASGATLDDAEAIGTIENEDSENEPTISIDDESVFEVDIGGSSAMTFTVTLSAASTIEVTVDYATADLSGAGAATAGEDYIAITTSTLTFAPGELSKTFDVTILGDVDAELNETFAIQLSNQSGASLTGNGSATGTILNDDIVPTLSIADVGVVEPDTGRTLNMVFTLTLDSAPLVPFSIDWEPFDQSTTIGTDWTASSGGTVDFALNETSKTVTVVIKGDNAPENTEMLRVDFTKVNVDDQVTIANASAYGRIVDNESHCNFNNDNDGMTAEATDLVVGAPQADGGGSARGTVYILLDDDLAGGAIDTVATLSINGFADDDELGAATTVLDFNGDGMDDLAVGASGNGTVYLFLSTDPMPTTLTTADADLSITGTNIGSVMTNAGDMNGDGYEDLALGVSNVTGTGSVYIFYGAGTIADSTLTVANDADVKVTDAEADSEFGTRVLSAGDIDADGLSDLMIGAPGVASEAGSVYIILGSATLGAAITSDTADIVLAGEVASARFGQGLYAPGDINDDMIDDLVVGSDGGASAGSAYVLFGSLIPLAAEINASEMDSKIDGEAADDGFAVGRGNFRGDINGDGVNDLILAASEHDGAGTSRGRVYAIFGGGTVFTANVDVADADVVVTGSADGLALGSTIASIGNADADVDGLIDLGVLGNASPTEKLYVFPGSAAPIAGTATEADAEFEITAETADDGFGTSID